MIGIITNGDINNNMVDDEYKNPKTDLYDIVKTQEPYQDSESSIDDKSFVLLDISIDGYSSVEYKELVYNIALIPYSEGGSILDVGCGVSDLYGYMNSRYKLIDELYNGIDFNTNKIELSKLKYKNIKSNIMDLEDIDYKYDYVFAINTFNDIIYNDMYLYLEESIDKLYNSTNKCLIFNILNEKTKLNYDDDRTKIYSFDVINDILNKYDFYIHRTEYNHGESMVYIFKPESI